MSNSASETADQWVPIAVKDFLSGPELAVDLFIRLGEKRFVLIAKAGSKTQIGDLRAVKNDKVETIYVRRSEYQRYVDRSLAVAEVIIRQAPISAKRKVAFLKQATQSVFQEIERLGPSKEAVHHAKQISQSTIGVVEKQPRLADLLASIANDSDWILNHSLAVSAFSVMVALEMGWQNAANLEKLSLGGLLHNIGLREIPRHIVDKARAEMSQEEVSIYETHPYRGMLILQSVGNVPDDVVSITYEHHENSIGQGYPRKIRDLRMNPLARVVALCAQFCELIIENPNCPDARTPEAALSFIDEVMGQPFNKEARKALSALVLKDLAKQAAS